MKTWHLSSLSPDLKDSNVLNQDFTGLPRKKTDPGEAFQPRQKPSLAVRFFSWFVSYIKHQLITLGKVMVSGIAFAFAAGLSEAGLVSREASFNLAVAGCFTILLLFGLYPVYKNMKARRQRR